MKLKNLIVSLIVAAAIALPAHADEGMWLLPYLQKMNIKDMKAKGLKLSAEDIYSVNNSALKDAIVIFGGGCTGEVVSSEGLLLTNHHCGYGSIQALSSVEHDYLKNGFWAMSREQELPAPGLQVRFVRQIIDVTAEMVGNVPSTAGQEEYEKITRENRANVMKELEKKYPDMELSVKSFFGGNQYFAFVIEVFSDVRLVGTPPTSIGKFGGDTDNWMWPRHTGDFSMFRIYADKNNKPAAYSPDNVPYKPAKHLKVSLTGVEEGDYTMIMGFPGSTQRYMTSYEIDEMLKVTNPQRIYIRGERQAILKEDMQASDKIRIQYASKYASSSNYWKNSIGMSRGVEKLNVKAKKEAQEQSFQSWANANTLPEEGYIDALSKIREAVAEREEATATSQYLSEAFLRAVEFMMPALRYSNMKQIANVDVARKQAEAFFKDYSPSTDRKVTKRMLTIVRENMKTLPSFYADEVDAKFGGDVNAYVDYLFDNSIFVDEAKTMALVENFDAEKVAADPAIPMVKSVYEMYYKAAMSTRESGAKYAEGHRKYIAGLMQQQPNKMWYSDANFTIRLTYGNVGAYDPKDGVMYKYYTTLRGVMEKEDPSNPMEFTVPARLKELYEAKDFGRYADKNGELRVGFISNNDITGGNSGSPVMNARGELIGLAFDGNWEAMSGDIAFEPELQRTISVDIRYVLFVIDKFAGAGHLVDEMTLTTK